MYGMAGAPRAVSHSSSNSKRGDKACPGYDGREVQNIMNATRTAAMLPAYHGKIASKRSSAARFFLIQDSQTARSSGTFMVKT